MNPDKQRLKIAAGFIFGLFACCSVWAAGEGASMTIKPMLGHAFGSILKIEGTLCRGSNMGRNYKGAEADIFLRVTAVNGSRVSKEVLVFVRGFNGDIAREMEKRSTREEKVSLVGYESFAAAGMPPEVSEYADIPQSRDWYVDQFFVVVKCAHSMESHEN